MWGWNSNSNVLIQLIAFSPPKPKKVSDGNKSFLRIWNDNSSANRDEARPGNNNIIHNNM